MKNSIAKNKHSILIAIASLKGATYPGMIIYGYLALNSLGELEGSSENQMYLIIFLCIEHVYSILCLLENYVKNIKSIIDLRKGSIDLTEKYLKYEDEYQN